MVLSVSTYVIKEPDGGTAACCMRVDTRVNTPTGVR